MAFSCNWVAYKEDAHDLDLNSWQFCYSWYFIWCSFASFESVNNQLLSHVVFFILHIKSTPTVHVLRPSSVSHEASHARFFFKTCSCCSAKHNKTRELFCFPVRSPSCFSSVRVWSVFVHRPQIVDCMETAVKYEQSLTPLRLLERRLRSMAASGRLKQILS